MKDVRLKIAAGNGAIGKPRCTLSGARRKPKDNSTVGSPIWARYA